MTTSEVRKAPLDLSIAYCTDPGETEELAHFFASNVAPDYISHHELQGPRALAPQTWAPNLIQTLIDEFQPRVISAREGNTSAPIIAARRGGTTVAVALLSFFPNANVPYAIIEDLVVASAQRGEGIGAAVLNWIFARALANGCDRVFLESGAQNDRAHHFFEEHGFQTCSVVMMKPLA